jgi:hypothetical protein
MAGTSENDITHPWLKGPLTADGVVSALRTLGRKVTALPPRHFVPLNEALTLVKGRLGSYSLAVHDLTRQAYAGELKIGARMIQPDGSEEVFLLRRVAWQWHVIRDHGSPGSEVFARVRGPIFSSVFGWHFFVGRRRFERLYSTVAPSGPAVPSPRARSGGSRKTPERPPTTAKEFVPYAVERWPRREDEAALKTCAPQLVATQDPEPAVGAKTLPAEIASNSVEIFPRGGKI